MRIARISLLVLLVSLPLAGLAEAQEKAESDQLDAFVAEALRESPDIRRSHHAVKAAHEVPSRVGALPDPVLSASLQNVPFNDIALSASPMTGLLVGVSQGIPFPGKLGRREAAAEAMAAASQTEADLVRALVALQVRQAYWQLSFAERAYEITVESERAINALTDAVIARFSVGEAAQQDAVQAEVAHSRLRAMLARRRQAIVSARRALNGAMGRRPELPIAEGVARPPTEARRLDPKGLAKRSRHGSPVIAAARARRDAASRAIDEARRDRLPDFQVGAGYRFRSAAPGDRTQGADMFQLTFGMTLPVWMGQKQNARLREAVERRGEAEAAVAAVELQVTTALERQLDAIQGLDQEIQLHEHEILPQADQALDASITDYQFARLGFVTVLRNWETELEAELEYARLLAERAERLAMVDYLTGAPVGASR